ncbi:MAG: hypothetical protein ACRCYP_05420, partial [Alphaproteobacteria bacterium]
MPNAESIMDCLTKDPTDCTDEEKEGMSIYYNVAIASLENDIKKQMGSGDMWVCFKKTGQWESIMSYGLALIELASDLTNIREN